MHQAPVVEKWLDKKGRLLVTRLICPLVETVPLVYHSRCHRKALNVYRKILEYITIHTSASSNPFIVHNVI